MKTEHISDRQLMNYRSHEIPEPEKQQIEIHIKDCAVCRQKIAVAEQWESLFNDDRIFDPPDEALVRARNRFRMNLASESSKSRRGFFWNILDSVPKQIETRKLAFVLATLLFGMVIGRYGIPRQNDLSSQLLAQMLTGDILISRMEALPASQVRFHTLEETTVRGSMNDPAIQQLLAHALMYETRDNMRFRSLDMIQNVSHNETLEPALLYALQHDKNPGLRLRVIKILKNFPINETMKNILIRLLYIEKNPAVRYYVVEKLSESNDPDIRPMLEKQAEKDPIVQSYIAGHPQSRSIAIERTNNNTQGDES